MALPMLRIGGTHSFLLPQTRLRLPHSGQPWRQPKSSCRQCLESPSEGALLPRPTPSSGSRSFVMPPTRVKRPHGRGPNIHQLRRLPLTPPKEGSLGSSRSRKWEKVRGRQAVNLAKMLTNQIATAGSLTELSELAHLHSAYLDHIHLTALIVRTAQLTQQHQQHQQQQQRAGNAAAALELPSDAGGEEVAAGADSALLLPLLDELQLLLQQRLRHTSCESITACTWALARLARGSPSAAAPAAGGWSAPTSLVSSLADRCLQLLPHFTPSQQTLVLWGLAKLGFRPEPAERGWLEVWLASLQPYLLTGGSSSSGGGSTNSSSSANNERSSSSSSSSTSETHRSSSRGSTDRSSSNSHMGSSSRGSPRANGSRNGREGQDGSSTPEVSSSSSSSRHSSKGGVEEGCLLTMADLSLLIYSLAVMRRNPSSQWLSDWLSSGVTRGFAAANPQDLSIILWALATLGLNPGVTWVTQVLSVTGSMLDRFPPQSLAISLWSLARMGHPPPAPWLTTFFTAAASASSPSRGGLPPRAVATTLAGLALLNPVAPPLQQTLSAQLPALLEANRAFLGGYGALELSQSLCGLARLSLPGGINRQWLLDFYAASRQIMKQPQPPSSASTAPSGADPGATGVARCEFTGAQLATVLWSLALLQLQPPKEWLAAALAALQPQLTGLTECARCGLVWALTVLRPSVPSAWWQDFLDVAFAQGLAEHPTACAQVLFCVSSLDHDYMERWLESYLGGAEGATGVALVRYGQLAAVLQQLDQLDSRQLAREWLSNSGGSDWSSEAATGSQVAPEEPPAVMAVPASFMQLLIK